MKKMNQILFEIIPNWIVFCISNKNEIILYTRPKDVEKLLFFLKNHMNARVKTLVDVCGADYPYRLKRFEVVYQLLSVDFNSRITVKVCLDEVTPVKSMTSLFCSAGWFERETWDMYGIHFLDHCDLRRILTDYGFEGFPLRKDFPLSGFTQVKYDDTQKCVITEPLELSQECRYYDFSSPWA
jgi:NADH/F420H2 dehydrogenase subunit C